MTRIAPSLKVAAVQMNVVFGTPERNVERICQQINKVVQSGVELIVFPEASISGYCFSSPEEARANSLSIESEVFKPIFDACRQFNVSVVFGFIENGDDCIFNTAALVGPEGLVLKYRKIHLPFLGVDRFVTRGMELKTVDHGGYRIGLNICYDCSFPESIRSLMLDGAEIVCLPTNWPPTSGRTADVIPPARALENAIFLIVANRIGQEKGFSFIGKSQICDPAGKVLAKADHDREEIIFAELDLELARRKHIINIPGEHEVHRVEDRYPPAYTRLHQGLTRGGESPFETKTGAARTGNS